MRTLKAAGYNSYWTGHAQFTTLAGQQIMIRRMPGIPASVTPIYHYDFLRADGPWPHLSMRQRENFPDGVQSVRRVLQYTNTFAPSLIASAEQFYKEYEDGDRTEPATYGGFDVAGDRILSRAVLDNGQSISFLPVYNPTIPEGFVGSDKYAWQIASMTTPVSELISDEFNVGDVTTLKLLTTGVLRKDVELSIEEVKQESITKNMEGSTRFSSFAESDEKTSLELSESNKESSDDVERETFHLTNGADKIYRLRLKYTGGNSVVYREDVDIAPEEESFEKQGGAHVQIVDLKNRRSNQTYTASELHIYPNPSADRVTVIVGGQEIYQAAVTSSSLTLEVVDALGRVMLTSPVRYGEAVDIIDLPSGMYAVHVRAIGSYQVSAVVTGRFVILK